MPLVISDETLSTLKLNEREARIEIACRLFGAGKMTLAQARRFADMERIAFEDELKKREIPAYIVTAESLASDLEALKQWKDKKG
jgi:predicted HTH domain antitoxin